MLTLEARASSSASSPYPREGFPIFPDPDTLSPRARLRRKAVEIAKRNLREHTSGAPITITRTDGKPIASVSFEYTGKNDSGKVFIEHTKKHAGYDGRTVRYGFLFDNKGGFIPWGMSEDTGGHFTTVNTKEGLHAPREIASVAHLIVDPQFHAADIGRWIEEAKADNPHLHILPPISLPSQRRVFTAPAT